MSSTRRSGLVSLRGWGEISKKRMEYSTLLKGTWRSVWVKVKVKFTLEQATKTQRGSRVIALLFP